MANDTNKSFLSNLFKIPHLDEDDYDDEMFDDDYDDDDDDDDYDEPVRRKSSFKQSSQQRPVQQSSPSRAQTSSSRYAQSQSQTQQRPTPSNSNSKLVDFNNQRAQKSSPYKTNGEVYVMKPMDTNDSQLVANNLLKGITIILNMEGLELDPAQHIIDFVCGACYALGGTMKAISSTIFIAAPRTTEVTGDTRDEIINEALISSQLGKF